MASVLFVSKPLVPPWNDSSKNLARDVAAGLVSHEPVVLTDGAGRWRPPRGRAEGLYRHAGRFSVGLDAQIRVMGRLLAGRSTDLWHFFFAPNPKSSAAGRAAARLRRTPTVQTVCSRPRDLSRAPSLLFADRTVVLSRRTFEDLVDARVPAARLAHVPPAVPPLTVPDPEERRADRAAFDLPADAPLVLYPGDLELGDGAPRVVDAFARLSRRDAILVMACRPKTKGAAAAEREVREQAQRLGVAPRVRWVGETRRIHALLACADVVALPSTDLYAKMDLPLVLLEAMWLERPVVVAEESPAAELADEGGARAVAADPDAIAGEIERVLDDSADRAELGRRAREVAAERYAPERMVRAYESIYDDLLAG